MKIWKQEFILEALTDMGTNSLGAHLGMEFTEYGDDFLKARMPVDARTVQPARILHGGASVALAETVGSVASFLCLNDLNTQQCVGLEINASHLRAVPEGSGYVTATCTPIRIGRTVHVWDIRLQDDRGHLTCIVRLTMAILEKKAC